MQVVRDVSAPQCRGQGPRRYAYVTVTYETVGCTASGQKFAGSAMNGSRLCVLRRTQARRPHACPARPAVFVRGSIYYSNMTSQVQLPQLREQATALRLAGKSLREIKEITGVTSNSRLSEALRGVPPPAWTRRPRAKDDARIKARELRARGYSMLEIAAELGVSKSSVSLWTRDMPRVGRLSNAEIRQRNAAGVSAFWAEESPRREARRRAVSDQAARQIGSLTDREVIIAGAMAYWCEGSKNKPYRRQENEVAFINSDPKLILFFLRRDGGPNNMAARRGFGVKIQTPACCSQGRTRTSICGIQSAVCYLYTTWD